MRNIDLTEQAEKLKKKNELKINRETKINRFAVYHLYYETALLIK